MNRRRAAGAEGALHTFSRLTQAKENPCLHRRPVGRACREVSPILSAPPGTNPSFAVPRNLHALSAESCGRIGRKRLG